MITQLDKGLPITDNGEMLERFFNWHLNVTNLSVLAGTGSPEGLVDARKTRFYMDESGSSGSVLYIKQLNDIGGNRKMGWVAIG